MHFSSDLQDIFLLPSGARIADKIGCIKQELLPLWVATQYCFSVGACQALVQGVNFVGALLHSFSCINLGKVSNTRYQGCPISEISADTEYLGQKVHRVEY